MLFQEGNLFDNLLQNIVNDEFVSCFGILTITGTLFEIALKVQLSFKVDFQVVKYSVAVLFQRLFY